MNRLLRFLKLRKPASSIWNDGSHVGPVSTYTPKPADVDVWEYPTIGVFSKKRLTHQEIDEIRERKGMRPSIGADVPFPITPPPWSEVDVEAQQAADRLRPWWTGR